MATSWPSASPNGLPTCGKRVTLVTSFDRVSPYTDFTLEGPNLRRMMREKNIAARVGHWVERAEMAGGRVDLALFDVYRDGSRRTEKPQPGSLPRRAGSTVDTLRCDSVVLCTGRRSNDGLYRDLSRASRRVAACRTEGGLPRRRLPGATLHRRRGVRRPPDRSRNLFARPAAPARRSSGSKPSGPGRKSSRRRYCAVTRNSAVS